MAADVSLLDALKTATYSGMEDLPESVTLVDGAWEGESFVEGGAARPRVELVSDFVRRGDLDGDGSDEAIVLLATSSGGSGTFDYLAVMARRDEALVNVATAALGDRVQVREARVEGARLVIDVVQAGPDDAMCCPTQLATRQWRLTSDGLVEGPAVVTGQLTLDVLAGTEWVLRAWTWSEPAPEDPRVTVTFSDGRLSGSSGCNRYTAGVTVGESVGSIVVSQVAGTRMLCPDEAMAVEGRFLDQLAQTTQYSFIAGRLALTFDQDGSPAVMLFERAAATPEPSA